MYKKYISNLDYVYILNILPESLVESLPQVHILACLAGLNSELIVGKDSGLFWASFSSSMLSSSFALAKFLKTGPCRLEYTNQPKSGFWGYANQGFILLYLNIAFTISMKGLNIGIIFYFKNIGDDGGLWIIVEWFLFNILPQFLFVSVFL